MPELPEVETTRAGIAPLVEQQTVSKVVVRNKQLRWPVPAGLDKKIRNQSVRSLKRRAKYLLFEFDAGTLMIHLRMSGSMRINPIDTAIGGDYLFRRSRGRRQSIKTFIMDSRIVVGVGNIYASEALFEAGIAPGRQAGKTTQPRYERLAEAIKTTLNRAIAKGGTTLRDFTSYEGQPGYFRHELKVYDRADEACRVCGDIVRMKRLGQRSTYYCTTCQH